MSALDAQLVRRAEATLELANAGVLDPASALLLADAATESIERTTELPVDEDLLDGQHFGGREDVEGDLTAVLVAALTDPWPHVGPNSAVSTFVPGPAPTDPDDVPTWLSRGTVVATEELTHVD